MSKDRSRRQRRQRQDPFQSPADPTSAGHRHERLGRLIEEELSALLSDELGDPALHGVRFTTIELSVDYASVRVRFTVPVQGAQGSSPGPALRAAAGALLRATGFLRTRLAETLDLKRVPTLRFVANPLVAVAVAVAVAEGAVADVGRPDAGEERLRR